MLSKLEFENLELSDYNHNSLYLTGSINSKLLSLNNASDWSEYLSRLPEEMQDIYYSPEYYNIWEKNGAGKAYCFIFEDGNNIAVYPFLLNRINDLGYELDKPYFDIQGAYGYNGVVYSSDHPGFRKKFYIAFSKFCIYNNIIAEFTRFHPLIGNHKFSEDFIDVIFDRKSVHIDLKQKYDDIVKNYTRSARQNLRTAAANDLNILVSKDVFPYKKEFTKIYKETMDRVKAEKYFYFSDNYFDDTFKIPSLIQFMVFSNKVPIASALCIGKKNYLHVHLLASKTDFLFNRPNNFLINKIIQYGIGKGFNELNLEGGRSSAADDSLLRFKKNFSKMTCNFYIGKKIYNRDVYQSVIYQWKKNYPEMVDKHFNKILKYRYFE
ncbi:MAG TPA: hypothetical protein DHV28_01010 [Ignavibacteriales bacterium]|nr:hypothetical protein [Ignavibacteriales bacterium]